MLFLGAVPYEDVPKYLLMSDILIAPFDTSNFPYLEKSGFWWCPVKLFEYLAAGKPIVSFDFEEVKNIVGDAALLAKPGNLNQFNEYLDSLIKDESLREKLGSKGKEIAEQCSWQKRAEETVKVYEKVITY
jgi:glycosyltransferase involved in cell wall biosynthesis